MDVNEIRELTDQEIESRIAELKHELFALRFRSATQPLENPKLIEALRRDVARMKTVLRERELSEAAASEA